MEEYLNKNSDFQKSISDTLSKMLIVPKNKKNVNLCTPIQISRDTARSIMEKFAPKHGETKRDQFDSSNLKAILNNCVVYENWKDHNLSTGWLQTFQVVATMRNNSLGHNNPYRLRIGYISIFLYMNITKAGNDP